jgi:hypothetical protein
MDEYKIEFIIGVGDFERIFCRKPKSKAEFKEFCILSKKDLQPDTLTGILCLAAPKMQ